MSELTRAACFDISAPPPNGPRFSRVARDAMMTQLGRHESSGHAGCNLKLGGAEHRALVHDASDVLGGHAPIRWRNATILPK